MSDIGAEQSMAPDLTELSRKARLVVSCVDSALVDNLFDQLEKYDAQERAETFNYLKGALNETRASLGAQPIYKNEEA